MSNQQTSERAAALLEEIIDLLVWDETAPHSPIDGYAAGKARRRMRRAAELLRRGEARPKYRNLFTAEQLADICERTAKRDEMRQKVKEELVRTGREMARLIEEDPEGTRQAIFAVYLATQRLADAQGPDSEAARRYRQVRRLTGIAESFESHRRRGKPFDEPRGAEAARDGARAPGDPIPLIPAEILDHAPAGEAILPFPGPGEDSGRPRILIRIDVGPSSWIGSFEAGFKPVSTVFMMPDNQHLFVSAGGAGYILDAGSRRLVERTGTEIVGVTRDAAMTLFVVNHNDVSFEAFGPAGRIGWGPGPIARATNAGRASAGSSAGDEEHQPIAELLS